MLVHMDQHFIIGMKKIKDKEHIFDNFVDALNRDDLQIKLYQ